MKLEDLEKRVTQLIEKGRQTLSTRRSSEVGFDYVQNQQFNGFRASSLSFLERTFGKDHPYGVEFREQVKDTDPRSVENGIGILEGAKDEMKGGWLFTTKGIISAEIFSDFLEMASYLLGEGYKDAAAVMIGSVLEEHLRQLCTKGGIHVENIKSEKTVPKKADLLNSELAAANTYTKLDQKSVTAWLDLRNKAAHGKYTEYSHEQVELMLNGVTEFMSRAVL